MLRINRLQPRVDHACGFISFHGSFGFWRGVSDAGQDCEGSCCCVLDAIAAGFHCCPSLSFSLLAIHSLSAEREREKLKKNEAYEENPLREVGEGEELVVVVVGHERRGVTGLSANEDMAASYGLEREQ